MLSHEVNWSVMDGCNSGHNAKKLEKKVNRLKMDDYKNNHNPKKSKTMVIWGMDDHNCDHNAKKLKKKVNRLKMDDYKNHHNPKKVILLKFWMAKFNQLRPHWMLLKSNRLSMPRFPLKRDIQIMLFLWSKMQICHQLAKFQASRPNFSYWADCKTKLHFFRDFSAATMVQQVFCHNFQS